ncbi:MAG: hypothetical protein ABI877_02835 [Gemmatimonadaceae bacterium]
MSNRHNPTNHHGMRERATDRLKTTPGGVRPPLAERWKHRDA